MHLQEASPVHEQSLILAYRLLGFAVSLLFDTLCFSKLSKLAC